MEYAACKWFTGRICVWLQWCSVLKGLFMLGLFLVFVLVAVAYVRLKLGGASLPALALKALTTVLCIAMAVYAAHEQTHVSGWAAVVVLALVCGLLGDVFLDLKLIYRQDDAWFTYAGFIAFGVGHLLYWAYFFTQLDWSSSVLLWWLGLDVVLVVGVWLTEKPMQLDYGRFRAVSLLYALVLLGVLLQAAYAWWQQPSWQWAMFTVGMLAFVASDLILSQSYFGKRPEKPWMISGNYACYFGAQCLVAWSVWV